MALLASEQLSGGQVKDADQRTVVAVEGPGGGAVPVTATSSSSTANTLAGGTGTLTGGADAQVVAANASRKGLSVTVDGAATAVTYLLLGAGTTSATNFHISLNPGGSWDGLVSGVLWTGQVRSFSSGTPKFGVVEI